HHAPFTWPLLLILPLLATLSTPAAAQLQPERLYYQVNRPVPMRVVVPERTTTARPEIVLFRREPGGDAETPDGIKATTVAKAAAADGRVDLAALFPILWTTREPAVLFAQLVIEGERIGPPVVIEPLVTPDDATTELAYRLETAVRNQDRAALLQILGLPAFQLDRLSQTAHVEPPRRRVYTGIRTFVDQHILFTTSFGEIEVRLRPDAAPRTVHHVRELVQGGFYTGIDVHRVVNDDGRGRPFIIQAGDPTGEGFGGPGSRIDFEKSTLPHDFGILSLARQLNDPDSGGSQFFICLSRQACAGLDGQYASFAETVRGGDVIEAMAAVAVDLADPSDPNSPYDRPIEPPVIESAVLIDAPPFGEGAPAATRQPVGNVER
ncbi:MAG: peptidylprolyl isomerase, partial [Phycisphaerales bacterium]|nr:peptidylprolyl isomerase [Phycisphaerales bacterium]